MPAFDLVLFISKTLLLAFSAKAPAGKTKTPNLQFGLAKDQYKMRYIHTFPSVRRQSWPTKSYGHNWGQPDNSNPPKCKTGQAATKGHVHGGPFVHPFWQSQQSQADVLLLHFHPSASKRHFGAKR